MTRVAIVALCLCTLGCHSDPTADLTEQLKSSDVTARRSAARALGELGSQADFAVPGLQAALTDNDSEVRRLSTLALGKIGPAAKPALPALARLLNDKEMSVRLSAAFAAQKIDPANELYVPVLTQAMQMGEGGVIVSVGNMGRDAQWAVPALIALLKDRRPGIRRLSAETLGKIGPGASSAESSLHTALRDPDDRVREAAQQALAAIRKTPSPPR